MTDTIEMLPMPVRNYVDGDGLWETATGPYSAEETQAYARAVAEHNVKVRDAYAAADSKAGWEWRKRAETAEARAERLAEALQKAEAALADIGGADREPGDDVAWCERRAAEALPAIRAALRNHNKVPANGRRPVGPAA